MFSFLKVEFHSCVDVLILSAVFNKETCTFKHHQKTIDDKNEFYFSNMTNILWTTSLACNFKLTCVDISINIFLIRLCFLADQWKWPMFYYINVIYVLPEEWNEDEWEWEEEEEDVAKDEEGKAHITISENLVTIDRSKVQRICDAAIMLQ